MFWKHNCTTCQYIKSVEFEHRYGTKWDLYTHQHAPNHIEYVARHGDNPEDYFECSHSPVFMNFFKQT